MKLKIHIYVAILVFLICPIAQLFAEQPYHPEDGPLVGLCTVLGFVLALFYISPSWISHLIFKKKAKEWVLHKSEEWQKSFKMWHLEADYIYSFIMILLSFGFGFTIIII